MDLKPIILKTVFGPLELRARRSQSDVSKYAFAMCAGNVERALRVDLQYGNMPAIWRFARKGGFVRLALSTTADDVVTALMDALRVGRLVVASPGGGETAPQDAEQTAAWSAYY